MKTSKPTVRRLALLATSSFGALGLIALATTALTPARALAADECGVQAADGDPIVCAPGTYPTGIAYTGVNVPVTVQDGVTVTDGGINLTGTSSVGLTAQTVTPDTGDLQVTNTTGAGLSLTGGAVNVDLTDGDSGDTPGSITGTSGVVASGNGLNLNFGDIAITGTDPNGYGVYATSTGGGGTFITATGDISSAGVGFRADFDGSYNNISLGNVSGDQGALVINSTMTGGWGYTGVNLNGTTTGDVSASTVDGSMYVTANALTGNLQGAATGTGGVGVILTGAMVGNIDAMAGSGGAFVTVGDAASLTGDITVTTQNGGSATVYDFVAPISGNIAVTANGGGSAGVVAANVTGTGTPITITTDAGDAWIDLHGPVTGTSAYQASIHSGGSASISIESGVTASQSDFDISVNNQLRINNSGTFTGAIDFSIAPGGGIFQNNSVWDAAPITFTDAGDTIYNTNIATMRFGDAAGYDFKGGNDLFDNVGTVIFGITPGASTLTFANLESLTNEGIIVFGGTNGTSSDGETNDRLVADGAHYVGGVPGNAQAILVMDVNFSGPGQADCSAAVEADCMSLVGGSATSGPTVIQVNDAGGSTGSLNRIVLVDLHGGTSDPNAFSLPSINPIEKGMFYYRLEYDAANQQWALVGHAGRNIYQFGEVASSAQNLWYESAQTWSDLNADERDASANDRRSVWLKATKNSIDRSAELNPAERDQITAYNIGYTDDVKGYLGGVDVLRGDGYVVGLMAGHQDADVGFDASNSATRFKGENYGAYGSWTGSTLFANGLVQLSKLDVAHTGDWNTGGDIGKGKVKSTGAQVEAGARFPLRDGQIMLEPLAGLAYVTTKIDDLKLPGMGGVVRYQDPKSFRGSLGVRISGASEIAGGKLSMSATGRLWNEFKGDYKLALLSAGQTQALGDDFSGGMREVGVSVGYSLPNTRLTAFVNGDAKFKKNYTDSAVAVGVRMSW